jgi:hypothetical protein
MYEGSAVKQVQWRKFGPKEEEEAELNKKHFGKPCVF